MSPWKMLLSWFADALGVARSESEKEPVWLEIALSQLGVAETPGTGSTDAILRYHRETSLKASSDEVPWCSSFVNWVMKMAGIPGTRSAAARSWLKWGVPTQPRLGAIAILKRGKNSAEGHVGFYVGNGAPGRVIILGGNQGNKVSKQEFPDSQVIGYRWPEEVL